MSIQNERIARSVLCVVILSVEKLSRGLRGLSWSETYNLLSWSEISLSWSECRFRLVSVGLRHTPFSVGLRYHSVGLSVGFGSFLVFLPKML